jgi:hypothetical protein
MTLDEMDDAEDLREAREALDDAKASMRCVLDLIDQAFIAGMDNPLKMGECLGSAEYILREALGIEEPEVLDAEAMSDRQAPEEPHG